MLKYKIPQIVTLTHKLEDSLRGKKKKAGNTFVSSAFLSSLLSDSNQRPRDYKSRALAN